MHPWSNPPTNPLWKNPKPRAKTTRVPAASAAAGANTQQLGPGIFTPNDYQQALEQTGLVSSAVIISPPDTREGNAEVDEDKLEAYAIVTAMGPTYLWFQLFELFELGKTFGLTDKQAWKGIKKMLKGAVETVDESGLTPEEVMDLVPVKPLGEDEAAIRNAYRTKLTGLYGKLKG